MIGDRETCQCAYHTQRRALTGADERSLATIAREIVNKWKPVSVYAKPYLDALRELHTIEDTYGADEAKAIVAYFLSNATTWRGPDARRIKAELNKMLKEARK